MNYNVNGITYHIEICGEGFPLLMLHGFTGRGSNWKPFCSTIGQHSTMIMPDIIGHGKTVHREIFREEDIMKDNHAFVDERYEIESVAKDMIKICDELGFEKFDLLGYSMGGRLAISMALLFPNRIRKLVIESASPGLKSEEERSVRYWYDLKLGIMLIENGIEEFVDVWEKLPIFKTQLSLPSDVKSSIRQQRLMNNPYELGRSLTGMGLGAQPSYWERLNEIETEVLMIVGELDQKFCQIAEEMQKLIKNGEIYKVEQSGHAIHVEQPEKFGTIVSEFLSIT